MLLLPSQIEYDTISSSQHIPVPYAVATDDVEIMAGCSPYEVAELEMYDIGMNFGEISIEPVNGSVHRTICEFPAKLCKIH